MTWNFSYVLRGRGHYRVRGQDLPVRAPCVLTQYPDEPMHYGPGPGETWEELFVIHPPGAGEGLVRMRCDPRETPLWHVADAAPMRAALRELFALLERREDRDALPVDRIDRCCERLLLESRLGALASPPAGPAAAIEAIRHRVELRFRDEHDFDALAREHGLSPARFRRHWDRLVGTPPARHLAELRLREACRLLAEDERPIGAVAADVGFRDPLYFARRFRRFTGMTASRYRRLYRQRA